MTFAIKHPAVILLGHGSRLPDASQAMVQVAEQLRERHGYEHAVVCHMEHATPTLADAVNACVADGQRDIVVLPYFLHAGVHLTKDIPEMIDELRARHPDVRVTVGPYLGFDDSLVSLVHDRIQQVVG